MKLERLKELEKGRTKGKWETSIHAGNLMVMHKVYASKADLEFVEYMANEAKALLDIVALATEVVDRGKAIQPEDLYELREALSNLEALP